MKQVFPAEFRLRSRADFHALRQGCRFTCVSLNFIYVRNRMNHARLGFAVSRRYGMSVLRNRFKRQLRDIFRRHPVRSHGVDILVTPKFTFRNGVEASMNMRSGLDRIAFRMKGNKA